MKIPAKLGMCPVFCSFLMALRHDTVTVNLYDGKSFSRLRYREISSRMFLVSGESESAAEDDCPPSIETMGVTLSPTASTFGKKKCD